MDGWISGLAAMISTRMAYTIYGESICEMEEASRGGNGIVD